MGPEKPNGNIRDYRDDFSLQPVYKLRQPTLVACHLDVEPMHLVFHHATSISMRDIPYDCVPFHRNRCLGELNVALRVYPRGSVNRVWKRRTERWIDNKSNAAVQEGEVEGPSTQGTNTASAFRSGPVNHKQVPCSQFRPSVCRKANKAREESQADEVVGMDGLGINRQGSLI